MPRKKVIDRQKIIDTSFRIIQRGGIDSYSARKLASELNISSMTFYNYFKNIDEIKKEVIIRGFNILYKMIFQEMKSQKEELKKGDIKLICRIFAFNMMKFALAYKEIYILMFTGHGMKFRKDQEVRPFFNFLPQLTDRINLDAGETDWKKRLHSFEILIHGLIMEKLRKIYDYSLEEYNDYLEFILKHLFED